MRNQWGVTVNALTSALLCAAFCYVVRNSHFNCSVQA